MKNLSSIWRYLQEILHGFKRRPGSADVGSSVAATQQAELSNLNGPDFSRARDEPCWYSSNLIPLPHMTLILEHVITTEAASRLGNMAVLDLVRPIADTTADTIGVAKSRVFAIVVAIDIYKYEEIPDLAGCENDGKNFLNFLSEVLHVPSSHIVFLANERATRDAILSAVHSHFIENKEINKGDAMILFYAGHGGRVKAPAGWLADGGFVETLCPHDEGTKDKDGNVVHGIPDRTFDGLMRRLAHEKGDNITAIFDCCHSGGMSRGGDTRARTIPLNVTLTLLPTTLDQPIWMWGLSARTATAVVPTGFLYGAMSSHVLLAACRPNELALEASTASEPSGAFTTALVKTLRECPLGQTSYSRVMELLPNLGYQHPQCEGINKDRILFDTVVVQDHSKSFKLTKQDDAFFVEAGSIHGVVEGTEFTVRLSHHNTIPDASQIRLVATHVEPLRCIVKCQNGMANELLPGSKAFVSNWNVYKMQVSFHWPPGNLYTIISPATPCDLVVHCNERGSWQLERCDPLTRMLPNRMLDIKQRPVAEVLDAIACFNHHLYRLNQAAPVHRQFAVQLRRLEKQQENVYRAVYEPVGDDLLDMVHPQPVISEDGSSYNIKEVTEAVITEMEPYYGLTLVNSSDFDLFPYVFYFDPSDYSIQTWYLPPSATMSPPLPRRTADGHPSQLPVGYGASGTDSIQFLLPPGMKVDSGFLKVFVSTSYVDMGSIKQSSPLDEPPRRARASELPFTHTWDAWIYMLSCCRT